MQTVNQHTVFPGLLAQERAQQLFKESQDVVYRRTDRMFAYLMATQWLAGVAAAFWISPQTWIGTTSYVHWHVWAAVFFGGAIAGLPIFLVWKQPGQALTRHVIAVAQMLTSALLIHLSGGRIETHFHVFGSLAFLAFYRDWRVIMTATIVVAADHFFRGVYWPQSVFGVLTASHWRWAEHAAWVIFEDVFLVISIRQSVADMWDVATRRAKLEALNAAIEQQVAARTAELAATQKMAADEAARFHFIFNSLPVGVTWMVRGEPATRMVNPAHSQITGVPMEKCHELELYRLATYSDDRDKQHDLHRQLDEGKIDHYTVEKRYMHTDGGIRWTSLTVRTFHDPATGQIQEISTLVDVTERVMAEIGLAETSEMMETLLANVPDTIYFKDLLSRFVRVSRSKEEQSLAILRAGHEAAHPGENLPAHLASIEQFRPWLVGKTDFNIFSEEKAQAAYEDEQEIIRTGRPIINRLEHRALSDGRNAWIIAMKMPWRDKEGNIVGTFGISKDITDIKAAETKLEVVHKELLEASRRAGMTEVATSVLHNVGNVLNSVNVSATLVTDQVRNSKIASLSKVNALLQAHEADLAGFLTNDPQGRQIRAYLGSLAEHLTLEQSGIIKELDSLRKNMEHIKDIVSMQQNYSKVYGIAETLPVVDLVEDALRMNAGAFVRHDVSLIRDYQAQPVVTLEKHKVLQILVNLMRNAKYACDESGRKDKQMKISVLNGDGRVKIVVADNGVGIPQENLSRIFAHGFTTRKDGHGYGLHSGALAARDLGGSLTAHSEGPGKGATFVLEVPLKQEGIRHE